MVDDIYIYNSGSAKQIEKFCYDTAEEMGLELADASWSHDIVEETYRLTITTSTGRDAFVDLTSAEIWAYPTEETNAKIRKEVEDLVD